MAAESTTFPLSAPSAAAPVLHDRLFDWYDRHARDLPWRRPSTSPYAVLVSEVMLQQTPVARVLPAYAAWLRRWPTVGDLAAATSGDAVRAWGGLGYPRRALRLHATARAVVARHGGRVPSGIDDLLVLPGVGEYTAAAVASFAYGRRHAVLDTNVRRVLARLVRGEAVAPPTLRAGERATATDLLPREPAAAAAWGVALMELGALLCTATGPACTVCPVADVCRWRAAGMPAYAGPPRRRQPWHGTDRQCRGRLLASVRAADEPLPRSALDATWPDVVQRERALAGLVADGLVEIRPDGAVGLPG